MIQLTLWVLGALTAQAAEGPFTCSARCGFSFSGDGYAIIDSQVVTKSSDASSKNAMNVIRKACREISNGPIVLIKTDSALVGVQYLWVDNYSTSHDIFGRRHTDVSRQHFPNPLIGNEATERNSCDPVGVDPNGTETYTGNRPAQG